jgi:hypothetical protein
MPHFECGAFNHSATSPEGAKSGQSPCGRDRLLGEVNEPDKRGADKIGPLRPEHNDFAIGVCLGQGFQGTPPRPSPSRGRAIAFELEMQPPMESERERSGIERRTFLPFSLWFSGFLAICDCPASGGHTVGAVADRWSRGSWDRHTRGQIGGPMPPDAGVRRYGFVRQRLRHGQASYGAGDDNAKSI